MLLGWLWWRERRKVGGGSRDWRAESPAHPSVGRETFSSAPTLTGRHRDISATAYSRRRGVGLCFMAWGG